MLNVKLNQRVITLQGSAAEFASLARGIRNSKAGALKEIETKDGLINLVCKGKCAEVAYTDGITVISYSESTKKGLYSLISMPSDTPRGSVFTIRPVDHEKLFSINSLSLELIVEK